MTTTMAWAPGERDAWLARAAALEHGREQPDWPRVVTGADRLTDLTYEQISWLIATGPDATARALIAGPPALRHHQRIDIGRVAVARFELDALPLALVEAGEEADRLGVLLLPFRAPEAATVIAGWLRHLGSARLWARLWLRRHPEAAAQALVPAVTGRPGRARQNAIDALRFLAADGHRELTIKTAEGYGRSTRSAVESALDPGAGPPPSSGKSRRWILPELRDTAGRPLPEDTVAALTGALARARLADAPEPAPGEPAPPGRPVPLVVESSSAAQPLVHPLDPEAARLIAGCDRASLAEFGRGLLDQWLTAGMPAPDAWILLAQTWLGDDATMDRLAPLIRSWPAKSRYARAIDGFAVLATTGSDVALRHLLAIEENMSGGHTNDRAVTYLAQAAAARGLTTTRLADRLTVTHGLDAGRTLDYGPRSFRVVTDDHLVPHAVAADGRVLARPPKPGAKDTNPAAYQEFLQLKKDLRATAASQAARLERDMLAHRRRPARDLAAVLLPHPVLGPLARRLLWAEYDAGDRLVRAVRIAEDGSFADLGDHTAAVAGDAPLGVVHPAELGAGRADWAQVFADYEILQPFPQVDRPAVVLAEEDRAATSLPGFGPVATDRADALLRAGWTGNGYPSATNLHTRLTRRLPGELTLVVELDPGVPTSSYYHSIAEQRITEIWADDTWSDHWQVARRTPMGACDPVALSELLVELYALKD